MPERSTPPSEAEVLERLVQEGMARMRWTRKKAEAAAKRYLNRLGKKAAPGVILGRIDRLNPPRELPKPKPNSKKRVIKKQLVTEAAPSPLDEAALKATATAAKRAAKKAKKKRNKKKAGVSPSKMTREAIAKLLPVKLPPPRPRPAKERLERALAPDDGRKSRGRGWLLQGGSPGLGRRS